MKVFAVKMKWLSTEVHVATGFATKAEAERNIATWRSNWRCEENPFYVIEEDDGDTSADDEQGITASSPSGADDGNADSGDAVNLEKDDGKSGFEHQPDGPDRDVDEQLSAFR